IKTEEIDLLQFHNVSDPQQSLAQFKAWKAQGVCRYIGITSTRHADFPAIEAVLAREKPDFVQIDYSLDDREAEKPTLPLAAEVKAGVLTALPYAVIPGTADPAHMTDNLGTMRGPLPDPDQRRQMVAFADAR